MAALFRVLHGGVLRRVINMKVKELGVLRNLKTLKVMDGGTLRLAGVFVQEMSVRVNPVTASDLSGGDTTNSVTAIVSGGLAPFSYSWVRTANPNGLNPVANSPTSASTTFTRTVSNPGDATFRVTVTDALGSTDTADVSCTWQTLTGGGA